MHPTITTLAPGWVTAHEKADALGKQLFVAEDAAVRLCPEQPHETLCRASATGGLWPADREWLERNRPRSLPAYDRWLAQCRAIDSAFGVEAVERAFHEAADLADGIAARIATMHPDNPAEAAIKFAVLLKLYGDGQGGIDQPGPIIGFLDDLAALASAGRTA